MPIQRIALISVHTSPLAPMGGAKTGGMNVYIRELSRELGRARRMQLTSLPDAPPRLKTPLTRPLAKTSASFISLLVRRQPMSPDEQYEHLSEFTANLMAFATLENLRYDIAYSHYWLSGWVAAKLKEAWGMRFVHMFHTLGHMKKRIEVKDYQPDRRIMTEMSIPQWADRIIAATPAEQAQLRWLYRARRRQIVVIPPGVNTERFNQELSRDAAREILGIPLASNLLLFVGRIEPLKAVDTILESLHVLREKAPSLLRNLHFMIVGGDPDSGRDQEMNRLQDLSVKLGIDQLVRFVGAKEQAELPLFYAAAAAVIMPSDYESFGMVALEAMSSGTPVIASQVGGLQFLVRDQETGFHIPAREPISLAECIIELLTDESRTEDMGMAASRIAQEYAWSGIAERLLRVFEDVACQELKRT